MAKKSKVAVIIGSDSDLDVIKNCTDVLKDFGIPYELRILSAHRVPDELSKYIKAFAKNNIKIVVAAAGGAAHLPGVIASQTSLPVVGVPVETKYLKGIDSLFSIVQMPKGVPVATMAIGEAGARNAAIFAAQVIALEDKKVAKRLSAFKMKQKKAVLEKDKTAGRF